MKKYLPWIIISLASTLLIIWYTRQQAAAAATASGSGGLNAAFSNLLASFAPPSGNGLGNLSRVPGSDPNAPASFTSTN